MVMIVIVIPNPLYIHSKVVGHSPPTNLHLIVELSKKFIITPPMMLPILFQSVSLKFISSKRN